MKPIVCLLGIFVFGILGSWAQESSHFELATEAYNNGEYPKAIEHYQAILESGKHSAAVYFNLGNAHYKLNQVAPSIYNYEKALLLAPADQEIIENLAFARNMTLDEIDVLPKNGISRFADSVLFSMSIDQWAWMAIAAIMLFVLTFLAYYILKISRQKRVTFIVSMAFLLFALFSFAMAYFQNRAYHSDQPAIIFSEEVAVSSEPNAKGSPLFTLHEGTKIQVLDTLGDWKKIRLADGKTGWLSEGSLKLLKDF